jgi:purine-nucleoside phosphorylase
MHLYEGHTAAEVVFPTRVLALAGIKTLVLTCAAGGIGQYAAPGSFMILADHLNFQGANPLAGPDDPRWGTRFVDLSRAYDPELRRKVRRAAAALRLKCFEGVYAGLVGPSFETPSEIRALRVLGADSVGMSTVAEAIAARQLGVRVLAVASITNRAAGLGLEPLSHEDVLAVGKQAARNLGLLLDILLPKIS